jgi:gamma-glutamyl phosphate reductase
MLADWSINKSVIAKAKKEAKAAKQTQKSVNYNKRKNKVLDMLVAEMNEKIENISSTNLDDILSKIN